MKPSSLILTSLRFHLPTQADLAALERHDPSAAAAVARVLTLPPHELSELAVLEGWGQLEPGRVAAAALAQRSVEASAARLLVGDVAWQFGAFERGFWEAGVVSREVRAHW